MGGERRPRLISDWSPPWSIPRRMTGLLSPAVFFLFSSLGALGHRAAAAPSEPQCAREVIAGTGLAARNGFACLDGGIATGDPRPLLGDRPWARRLPVTDWPKGLVCASGDAFLTISETPRHKSLTTVCEIRGGGGNGGTCQRCGEVTKTVTVVTSNFHVPPPCDDRVWRAAERSRTIARADLVFGHVRRADR